jgi:hypothetical protein
MKINPWQALDTMTCACYILAMLNGSQGGQGKRGAHRACTGPLPITSGQVLTPEQVHAISVSSANDSDTQGGMVMAYHDPQSLGFRLYDTRNAWAGDYSTLRRARIAKASAEKRTGHKHRIIEIIADPDFGTTTEIER